MKRWFLLAEVQTPDGSVMSLHRHDSTYVIRVNGMELMSTRHFASEERLAEVACEPLRDAENPAVLIGGLGLGFTLKKALALLPAAARVVVAELIPEVAKWNAHPEYPLAAAALTDPRTQMVFGDVAQVIAQSAGQFDAIMLDADNGTTPMSTRGNAELYAATGLASVRAALKPGGVAVYWSAQADPVFAKHMQRARFKVSVEKARSHATSGGWHTLIVGRRLD